MQSTADHETMWAITEPLPIQSLYPDLKLWLMPLHVVTLMAAVVLGACNFDTVLSVISLAASAVCLMAIGYYALMIGANYGNLAWHGIRYERRPEWLVRLERRYTYWCYAGLSLSVLSIGLAFW